MAELSGAQQPRFVHNTSGRHRPSHAHFLVSHRVW